VLAGVIGAFVAKGMEPRLAAAAGAVAHGVASRLVESQRGLVASDLLPALQRALDGEGRDFSPLDGSDAQAVQ
jgi:NAD(P)H-hydrate repair Nnr-like enzyme with NAD(P)H-hydrate dehydratase domain